MRYQIIHVDRRDIRRSKLVSDQPMPKPAPGQALLAIENFALTTNNVTYAATGDILGYWKFFPTGSEAWGVVPVWGIARVVASEVEGLLVGERLYGFYPMASHMLITPVARGAGTLRDVTPHRAELPMVYNSYRRHETMPARLEELLGLLYPLLATSYLISDFLEDNQWFGAKQIIVSSASSKTGLGLCHYLAEAQPKGPKIIGLTAKANRAFVEKLGHCDQIEPYDGLEAGIAQKPSVYVDMAGNSAVRARLHHHLGDNMVYSCAVGTSHWDKFTPAGPMPGAKPRFFFAPTQIEKRRQDWGPGQIEGRIDAAFMRVAKDSARWLEVAATQGLASAVETYQQLARGDVDPKIGHVVHLEER